MAFAKEQVARIGQSTRPDGSVCSLFLHATDAAAATVQAAGYFNDARAKLAVGDLVLVSCGFGGTPLTMLMRMVAVPSSGNVTTAFAITVA